MNTTKKLYLVRHAKTEHLRVGDSDYNRQLTQRGISDATEMGQRLKQRDVSPDLMITSGAARAQATAQLIAEELGYPTASIVTEDQIYEASTQEIIDVLQGIDDGFNHVMLIGHNPSITWCVSELSDTSIGGLPTGAVTTLNVNVKKWLKLSENSATIEQIDTPSN